MSRTPSGVGSNYGNEDGRDGRSRREQVCSRIGGRPMKEETARSGFLERGGQGRRWNGAADRGRPRKVE